jgi:multimeric flavodoxin WrbA
MKLLIFQGSPRPESNCKNLYSVLEELLEEKDIECDVLNVHSALKPCNHCNLCYDNNPCVIRDDFPRDNDYDGVIIISPIYFFSFNAQTKAFIDRLYSKSLEGVKIALILVSGDSYQLSGADLAVESILRTCDYCGCDLVSTYHKRTNDKVYKFTKKDVKNLKKLVESFEVV